MTTPGGNDGSPFDPKQNQNHNDGGQQAGSNPYQGNQPYGSDQQYGSPYDSGQQYGTGQPYSSYPGSGQPGFNTQEMKTTSKGFFGALFDFNFDNFIALKFAKFIYILATIMAAATLLFGWVFPFFGLLFDGAVGGAILFLLLAWIPVGLVALFQLIGIRLFLEFVVATIKTSDNTSRLVESTR